MRVEIIDSLKAFRALRPNWDAVYGADPDAQFFLSWTWLTKWLAILEKPWLILAARPDEEGSPYVAFLPLWIDTKERESTGFYNDLKLGSNPFADYSGLLCTPEAEVEAIAALASEVKRLNWTHFRLTGFYASERRSTLLLQEFSQSGFDIGTENTVNPADNIDLAICPFASLPGDWDAYLDSRLSANTRQKIRRLLRQLEKSADRRITHADSDTAERDIETLLRFWAERWGPRKGTRLSGIINANRTMLRHAFAAGSLYLPVLWHGERPVGALATFIDADKRSFLFFVAGRDQTYEGPPPGLLLHAHSIRHAISNGFTTYDFLRGNEPYKYSFGVEERRIQSLIIATKDGKNLGARLDRRGLPRALKRSMELHKAGRNVEAERGFRQILEVEPDNTGALFGLAQAVDARGDRAAAVGLFKAVVAATPDNAKAWYLLGRSLQATGEPWGAADAYCGFIERQPGIAAAHYELGHILLEVAQLDLAGAAFDAVMALEPDFPDIYASQLKVLQARGESAAGVPAPRLNAKVRDRVAKLSAIAAACDRRRQAMAKPMALAREFSGAGLPFQAQATLAVLAKPRNR